MEINYGNAQAANAFAPREWKFLSSGLPGDGGGLFPQPDAHLHIVDRQDLVVR
jgi:phage-related tail fiber protein